jgi:hypothetical protein
VTPPRPWRLSARNRSRSAPHTPPIVTHRTPHAAHSPHPPTHPPARAWCLHSKRPGVACRCVRPAAHAAGTVRPLVNAAPSARAAYRPCLCPCCQPVHTAVFRVCVRFHPEPDTIPSSRAIVPLVGGGGGGRTHYLAHPFLPPPAPHRPHATGGAGGASTCGGSRPRPRPPQLLAPARRGAGGSRDSRTEALLSTLLSRFCVLSGHLGDFYLPIQLSRQLLADFGGQNAPPLRPQLLVPAREGGGGGPSCCSDTYIFILYKTSSQGKNIICTHVTTGTTSYEPAY